MDLTAIREAILHKHRLNLERIGTEFPHCTECGVYDRSAFCGWTGGFYAGISHLCYEMTGEAAFLTHADHLTAQMERTLEELGAGLGHDIGMLFSPSAYASYLKKQDDANRDLLIRAARILATRFHEEGDYIQAWDASPDAPEHATRMIIDCMMNLPLLYRAAEFTGDASLADIATRHAKTAQKYLVRKDYTTAHTFVFYPNGQPKYQKTHQGYSDTSCWSRGQSWAVYGFALAYRFTEDPSFLETALKCADKFLELCEPNLIPKWDFDFKGRRAAPRDTSAAAIAACGLMEIFDHTGRAEYREAAEKILSVLYLDYGSFERDREEGMIREGTGHLSRGDNINVSLIYGDYFFCELFARVAGISRGYW